MTENLLKKTVAVKFSNFHTVGILLINITLNWFDEKKRLCVSSELFIFLQHVAFYFGSYVCKQRISRFSTITLNWDFTENLLVSTKNLLCVDNAYDTVLKSLVFFTKSWNRKVDVVIVVFYTNLDWLGVKVDTFSKL